MLLVFFPRLDFDIIDRKVAECIDKSTCQASVGEQRNIEVDACAANLITMAQLGAGEVFGDVHNKVDFLTVQEVESLRLLVGFGRPIGTNRRHTVGIEISMRSACGIELITLVV